MGTFFFFLLLAFALYDGGLLVHRMGNETEQKINSALRGLKEALLRCCPQTHSYTNTTTTDTVLSPTHRVPHVHTHSTVPARMAKPGPPPGVLAGLFALVLVLLAASFTHGFLHQPRVIAGIPSRSTQHQHLQLSRRYVLDPSVVTDVVTDVVQSGGSANGAAQVAEAMLQLLKGPSGVGIFGIAALSVRLYTYFTVQSYIAKLCTLFADSGTTVEVRLKGRGRRGRGEVSGCLLDSVFVW